MTDRAGGDDKIICGAGGRPRLETCATSTMAEFDWLEVQHTLRGALATSNPASPSKGPPEAATPPRRCAASIARYKESGHSIATGPSLLPPEGDTQAE